MDEERLRAELEALRRERERIEQRLAEVERRIAEVTTQLAEAGRPRQPGTAALGTGHWEPLALYPAHPAPAPQRVPDAPVVTEESDPPEGRTAQLAEEIDGAKRSRDLDALHRRALRDELSTRRLWMAAWLIRHGRLRGATARTMRLMGWRAPRAPGETSAPLRVLRAPGLTEAPQAPGLTEAPQAPGEDGLTPLGRAVLELFRSSGESRTPIDVNDIVARLAGPGDGGASAALIQRTVVNLAHPLLARIPLLEGLGWSDLRDPSRVAVKRVRMSPVGLEILEGRLFLPLLLINGGEGPGYWVPSHEPKGVLTALRQQVEHGPDVARLWSASQDPPWAASVVKATMGGGLLAVRPRFTVEPRSPGHPATLLVSDLPWGVTPEDVNSGIRRLADVALLEPLEVRQRPGTGDAVELDFELTVEARFAAAHLALDQSYRVPTRSGFFDGMTFRDVELAGLVTSYLEGRRAALRASSRGEELCDLAEAVVVAVHCLAPVLELLRRADDEPDAVKALTALRLEGMPAGLELRHDYRAGFTERQARHLWAARGLAHLSPTEAVYRWNVAREGVRTADELLVEELDHGLKVLAHQVRRSDVVGSLSLHPA